MKLMTICLLSMMSVSAQSSSAQSGTTAESEANPGRPTVSAPATLTPVGYLQFENGALFAQDSTEFSKRIGTSQVTKLAVLPRLELFLQIEPLVISRSEGLTVVHEGENAPLPGWVALTFHWKGCLYSGEFDSPVERPQPTVAVEFFGEGRRFPLSMRLIAGRCNPQ